MKIDKSKKITFDDFNKVIKTEAEAYDCEAENRFDIANFAKNVQRLVFAKELAIKLFGAEEKGDENGED